MADLAAGSDQMLAAREAPASYQVMLDSLVRPGYKQTAVGVIPQDWGISTLGEICLISSGTTPARNLADRYYRNGSVHWVKTLDLNDSEILNTDELVTLKAIEETSLRCYPIGTVLVAMYGGFNQIGRTGLLRIPAAVNQAITAIQPRSNKLLPEYLLVTLNFKVDYWRAVASSSRKDPNITSKDIRDFLIACPHLPEQRAIATVLSDVDALLASLDKLIAKKRDLKQGAMQQLLTGQRRLPGFSEEWEQKRLGEIGEVTSAGVNKKFRQGEIAVRLVNYLNVYRKDFLYSSDLSHTVTAPPKQAKRCEVKRGDIFFTPSSETRNDIGHSAVAMEDIPDAAYSYHIVRLRLHDDWDIRFRAYAFKTKAFFDQAQTLCDGSGTRYVISQGKFRSMTVHVPPIDEQTAIAAVLSDMDAEIAALEARRDKTRVLKQGMMQELLTGRIRLV